PRKRCDCCRRSRRRPPATRPCSCRARGTTPRPSPPPRDREGSRSRAGTTSTTRSGSCSRRVRAAGGVADKFPDPPRATTRDVQLVRPARADFIGMAVWTSKGSHTLHLDYRPRARHLYWPACWLLEGTLGLLLWAAVRAGRARAVRRSQLAQTRPLELHPRG